MTRSCSLSSAMSSRSTSFTINSLACSTDSIYFWIDASSSNHCDAISFSKREISPTQGTKVVVDLVVVVVVAVVVVVVGVVVVVVVIVIVIVVVVVVFALAWCLW